MKTRAITPCSATRSSLLSWAIRAGRIVGRMIRKRLRGNVSRTTEHSVSNIHFHMLYLDGVYIGGSNGQIRYELKTPFGVNLTAR